MSSQSPSQSPSPTSSGLPAESRRLPVIGFIALVVLYLVIVQGLGLLLTRGLDTKYAAPTSVNELWRSITVPVGLSVVLVAAVISWLRWWRAVVHDDRPVQRWLVIVPVLMLASVLIVTNYAGLADRGLGFAVLLLLSTLFVGAGEELMFRGLGVTVFRSNGFTEGKVALWSTVIFGLAHASNLISEGPGAFVQVLVTIAAGYFFYLIRRRSGGIWLPMLVHGLWDFSLVSAGVVPGKSYPLVIVAILTMIGLVVLLLVRRHHIEPVDRPAAV